MFPLSKLLSFVAQPVFWAAVLYWLCVRVLQGRHAGRRLVLPAVFIFGALGFCAIPDYFLHKLENRYATPPVADLGRYQGMIVLGGALKDNAGALYAAHHQVALGSAAERLTASAALMHRYPGMQLVFSGGEGSLFPVGKPEADLARLFYQESGVPESRLRFESASRNTHENAQFVAAMLGNECHKPWLLVTSGFHMPRAMAEFAQTGCNVTAFSVDFRTAEQTPLNRFDWNISLEHGFLLLHEEIGLVVLKLRQWFTPAI